MDELNRTSDKPGCRSKSRGFVLAICALVAAGCGGQQQKAVTGPVTVPDADQTETMEAAEDVLAKMHFEIEKADVAGGLIRTRPLPGAQLFEFWRSDSVGGKNSLLANMHSIRRTVELAVSRQDGQLQIACDVRVQRLALPERDVGSSARAYGIYTRSSPALQKMRFDPWQQKQMAWVDLDRDERLAAEILKRIKDRLASRTTGESEAAESRT